MKIIGKSFLSLSPFLFFPLFLSFTHTHYLFLYPSPVDPGYRFAALFGNNRIHHIISIHRIESFLAGRVCYGLGWKRINDGNIQLLHTRA
uniref:Uncharacterized protein n=1 Tax=Anopheles braziliensis TaxID=58242 RepID=A0A2M3ZM72_9DIPT